MSEKPLQNLEKIEEPKSSETELSPEVFEMVMSKVQDIDRDGIAYHSVFGFSGPKNEKGKRLGEKNALQKIFKEGLLGTHWHNEDDVGMPYDDKIASKKTWAKNVRENSNALIFFNIVGRGFPYPLSRERYPMQIDKLSKGNTNIIFDISKFEEKKGSTLANLQNQQYRVFRKTEPDSHSIVDHNYGFSLSYRVPPHLIQGVVIKVFAESVEAVKQKKKQKQRTHDPIIVSARANEIVSIMRKAMSRKEELLVPVYDANGDLIWPKKMSYEEVKKFVAERKVNKDKK